jgi:hypothetical protein
MSTAASQERYANSNTNSSSNVNYNHQHPTNPQDIGSELLHHLPHLKVGGLASVDTETLRAFVSPIYDALTSINAEELLDLERVTEGGAPLGNGYVRNSDFGFGLCLRCNVRSSDSQRACILLRTYTNHILSTNP